jgi:hypothetical protein
LEEKNLKLLKDLSLLQVKVKESRNLIKFIQHLYHKVILFLYLYDFFYFIYLITNNNYLLNLIEQGKTNQNNPYISSSSSPKGNNQPSVNSPNNIPNFFFPTLYASDPMD